MREMYAGVERELKIGIDPGIGGAIAFLWDDGNISTVIDMPIMSIRKGKNQVNAAELAKQLEGHFFMDGGIESKKIAYLEDAHAMPGQGVSGVFSFGQSFGIIQGVLGALQIPVVLVTPQSWKKRAGLIGKDKDMARTIAQRLYPEADLARKKDCGRADAILIARFGG